MEQYILKSAIVAEIKRLIDSHKSLKILDPTYCDGLNDSLDDILSFLDTLEVKDANEALRTEYEKGRADAFAQMQKEWSEEDEKMVANLVDYFKVDDALQYTEKQVVDWLKSLKQRIAP